MTRHHDPRLDTSRRGVTHVDIGTLAYRPSQLLRLNRMGRELRLTDQILSTDLDTLSIVPDGPAPAWTTLDGDHVSFSLKHMPFPRQAVDVAVWLGTNAHELGHVLFSPRRSSPLMQRLIEGDRMMFPGLATMANIAEDQRQERLLLGWFRPWTAYLTAALGHHLEVSDDCWLLMTGRTWLPDTVRAEAKARFLVVHGRNVTDTVTELIDAYQRLIDPGDTEADEAWDVLTQLYELFPQQPQGGCGTPVLTGGTPDTSEPPVNLPPTAGEAEGEGGKGESGGGDDEPNTGDDQPADDGKSKGGTGGGAGTGAALDDKAVRKELKDAAKEMLAEDSDDIDAVLDGLDHGRPGEQSTADTPNGRYEDATDAARRLHHEVGDALLDLKDASEPGWSRRVDSGRLNVRRLLDPNCEPDQLFDRYEPGQMDASELELVLLLDVSGSMGQFKFQLAEADWAIRQGMDDIEGRCTSIAWSSGPHKVIAQPDERPDDRMFVVHDSGGTEPKSALTEAFNILASSQAKNRLMVVLTDGDWSDGWGSAISSDSLIEAMNEVGIVTVCALFGDDVAKGRYHHCRYGQTLGDIADLARLFRDVAVAQIGQW